MSWFWERRLTDKLDILTYWQTLLKKCSYLEFFWSVFSRIQTRKTPITDTFYAVRESIKLILSIWNRDSSNKDVFKFANKITSYWRKTTRQFTDKNRERKQSGKTNPYMSKLWYFARFGTICIILKTWKTLMAECYF